MEIGPWFVELNRRVTARIGVRFGRDRRRRGVGVVGFGFEFGELVAVIARLLVTDLDLIPPNPYNAEPDGRAVTLGQLHPAMLLRARQPQRLGLGGGVMGGVDVELVIVVKRIHVAAAPVPQRRNQNQPDQNQQRNPGEQPPPRRGEPVALAWCSTLRSPTHPGGS